MKKNVVRLTESQLKNIITKVIKEEQELEVQSDETQLGLDNYELSDAANKGTIPSNIKQNLDKSPELQNQKNQLINQIDQYCKSGQENLVMDFLKNKIKEVRNILRRKRKEKKTQVQESMIGFFALGILAIAAFLGLCILIVRIFRGGDGCRKWSKYKQRNFVGYR